MLKPLPRDHGPIVAVRFSGSTSAQDMDVDDSEQPAQLEASGWMLDIEEEPLVGTDVFALGNVQGGASDRKTTNHDSGLSGGSIEDGLVVS
jgi:hypothetical protein